MVFTEPLRTRRADKHEITAHRAHTLPVQNVVARPVVRVWPLGRQGAIDASVDLNPFIRGRGGTQGQGGLGVGPTSPTSGD